jgi:predicted SAM-dependent methyltransferase
VLEFSPRYGLEEKFRKSDDIDYVSVDIKSKSVDVNVDITELPFDSESFDVIICSHILEHIPNDESAISELHRILSKKGRAFIMIPKDKGRNNTYENPDVTTNQERKDEFGHPYHERIYGQDFVDRLSKSGFNVNKITYPEQLDESKTDRMNLELFKNNFDHYRTNIEFDDIHVCEK